MQRPVRARHRALAQDRDREHARALVRAGRAKQMREYLEVLMPLAAEASPTLVLRGDLYRVNGALQVADGTPPAGGGRGARPEDARGRGSPRRRHREQVDDRTEDARRARQPRADLSRRPRRTQAKPAPRVIAGRLPFSLTNDPNGARERREQGSSRSTASCRPTARCSTAKAQTNPGRRRPSSATRTPSAPRSAALAEAGVTDFVAGGYGSGEDATRTHAFLRTLLA